MPRGEADRLVSQCRPLCSSLISCGRSTMRNDYIPLASGPEDTEKPEIGKTQQRQRTCKLFLGPNHRCAEIRGAVYISLICWVLTTAMSVVLYLHPQPVQSHSCSGNILLPEPDPYLNIRLEANSEGSSVLGFPQLMLQLDSFSPGKSMKEDSSRIYFSHAGTVFPDDRHFIVNSSVCSCMSRVINACI